MQIPSWTVDEMLAEGPCKEYTRERLGELWVGRERLTLVDILDLDIHVADKVWVCCRATALREPWLFGRVLTRCIRDHARNCGVPEVCGWAQRWLSGEDRTKAGANAAAKAAWGARAAWAASADAAWAANAAAKAAWGASAAAEAAWVARDAWAAARDAANAAGAEQERERQLQDMREIAEMCEGD